MTSDPMELYRYDVAGDLAASTQSGVTLTWAEYKRLYHHWRLNRNVGGSNELFLEPRPELYFERPDANLIV